MVVVITNLDMSLSLRSFALLEFSHIRRHILQSIRIKNTGKVRHIPNWFEHLDVCQVCVNPVWVQALTGANQAWATLATMHFTLDFILVTTATGLIFTEDFPPLHGGFSFEHTR